VLKHVFGFQFIDRYTDHKDTLERESVLFFVSWIKI